LACTMIGAILTHVVVIGIRPVSAVPVVLLVILIAIARKRRSG